MTMYPYTGALPAVGELRFGSVDSRPIPITWDREALYDDDTWSYHEHYTVTDSNGSERDMIADSGMPYLLVAALPDGTRHRYGQHEYDQYITDGDEVADGGDFTRRITEAEWDRIFDHSAAEAGSEGPMMNYWYPCPAVADDPAQAAYTLAGLPLCVVQIDGEPGLALTGGGMDLTWEIIEAFVRLGQYPPAHFAANLVRAGDPGHGRNAHDFTLILAAARSLEVVREAATRDYNDLMNAASRWSGGTFPGQQ